MGIFDKQNANTQMYLWTDMILDVDYDKDVYPLGLIRVYSGYFPDYELLNKNNQKVYDLVDICLEYHRKAFSIKKATNVLNSKHLLDNDKCKTIFDIMIKSQFKQNHGFSYESMDDRKNPKTAKIMMAKYVKYIMEIDYHSEVYPFDMFKNYFKSLPVRKALDAKNQQVFDLLYIFNRINNDKFTFKNAKRIVQEKNLLNNNLCTVLYNQLCNIYNKSMIQNNIIEYGKDIHKETIKQKTLKFIIKQ